MAKVITFSRTFPTYHPRKGEPTYFVEKFYNSLYSKNNLMDYPEGLVVDDSIKEMKWHTIRAGHRFKRGEYFSPRVWHGKPYNSKQIILAPDTEIKKIWNFRLVPSLWIDECKFFLGDHRILADYLKIVANNDGLELRDFVHWFGGLNMADSKRKPFDGQVICWSDQIKY